MWLTHSHPCISTIGCFLKLLRDCWGVWTYRSWGINIWRAWSKEGLWEFSVVDHIWHVILRVTNLIKRNFISLYNKHNPTWKSCLSINAFRPHCWFNPIVCLWLAGFTLLPISSHLLARLVKAFFHSPCKGRLVQAKSELRNSSRKLARVAEPSYSSVQFNCSTTHSLMREG